MKKCRLYISNLRGNRSIFYRIFFAADSMLRPLESLVWPCPLSMSVKCFSGAGLASVVRKCVPFSLTPYDVVVVHAGVNDASRGGDSFLSDFTASCEYARGALAHLFPDSRIVFSLLCLTSDPVINSRVAVANRLLRDLSLAGDLGLISNDNIRISDLTDTVHLNAAGTARLYGNILNFLRADAA